MKRLTKISLLVLTAALFLASCAFNRNSLIGSWKDESTGTILEFSVDGKIIQSSPDAPGSSQANDYQFLNDETITIIGTQNVLTFKVEGDKLTLSAQGQSIILTRVKE